MRSIYISVKGYANPGTNRPECPAFAWQTCYDDPSLDLDIIAWKGCPSDPDRIEFDDPPPVFLEVTEDSLLARFNELSDSELEATFGIAPSEALNGYITRVGLTFKGVSIIFCHKILMCIKKSKFLKISKIFGLHHFHNII